MNTESDMCIEAVTIAGSKTSLKVSNRRPARPGAKPRGRIGSRDPLSVNAFAQSRCRARVCTLDQLVLPHDVPACEPDAIVGEDAASLLALLAACAPPRVSSKDESGHRRVIGNGATVRLLQASFDPADWGGVKLQCVEHPIGRVPLTFDVESLHSALTGRATQAESRRQRQLAREQVLVNFRRPEDPRLDHHVTERG